ncbi:hypothetical protein B0H67DRAFT_269908 [Lasiosphaeris hirsuta]|uniref:SWIM-type domain-containing protein n=1 Tax=Lasiosphaeris hirsuta TaxID=260670 RepID=A0AA40A804_9PEZI|nr:hypothetical protein B0H67DRAFT_269908 [Lasiosphaeris hirsuta]
MLRSKAILSFYKLPHLQHAPCARPIATEREAGFAVPMLNFNGTHGNNEGPQPCAPSIGSLAPVRPSLSLSDLALSCSCEGLCFALDTATGLGLSRPCVHLLSLLFKIVLLDTAADSVLSRRLLSLSAVCCPPAALAKSRRAQGQGPVSTSHHHLKPPQKADARYGKPTFCLQVGSEVEAEWVPRSLDGSNSRCRASDCHHWLPVPLGQAYLHV